MNRKQEACLRIGFLLLIVVILIPPWRVGYFSAYSFLFRPPVGRASLELSRLLLEVLLVLLVTAGAFLLLRMSEVPKEQPRTMQAIPLNENRGRLLFILEAFITVLVLSFGVVSYKSISKIRRLEAGIQNISALVDSGINRGLPDFIPDAPRFIPVNPKDQIPKAPVGKLTPVDPKVETLMQIKIELSKMK